LLVAGDWLLVAGYWMLVAGCWLLDAGCWLLVAGCWLLDNKLQRQFSFYSYLQYHRVLSLFKKNKGK